MKIFLARQPIYDINKNIYGYEILYRNSHNNYFPDVNDDLATTELTSNLLSEFGFSSITNSKYGSINFNKDLLMSNIPLLFDPKYTIIEILEDVILDENLIKRLIYLKNKNYILALDDFVDDGHYDIIMDYIDIIKVEYTNLSSQKRKEIAIKYKSKRLIAERIETDQDYKNALNDGYQNFQGYYFSKPILVSKTSVSIATSTYFKLIKEIENSLLNYKTLSEIIKLDVSLTYKLLVYINSMAFYRGTQIKNIEQALVRMGTNEIRRWIILLLLRDITNVKDNEFIKQALIRGIFLEKITNELESKDDNNVAYIVGMMSKIENILDPDMNELLEKIDEDSAIRNALTGKNGVLFDTLNCIENYENSNWPIVNDYCNKYNISKEFVFKTYIGAVSYADNIFKLPS